MTMKLKARRFRIQPADQAPLPAPEPGPAAAANAGVAPPADEPGTDIDAVRREGLTARQLRMARRIAQKEGLTASSDHEAVVLLRRAGIDPFQRGSLLDAASADRPAHGRALALSDGGAALPDTAPPLVLPSPEARAEEGQADAIMRIQRDIARRRRRKLALLAARLAFFVLLQTILAGYYYYQLATPLFATKSEFVIQQAENPASVGGIGGLLSGTQFATAQDSMAVQGYLQSREAMQRLDRDIGFRPHFSHEGIDPIQRLAPDATAEDAYRLYTKTVKIAYDPTEGIVKLEVRATDPETSVAYATALISYAEEQVDHLTQRLREDQMAGARQIYDEAEAKMLAAQQRVVTLQERFKVLSSEVEVSLIASQLGQLESQLMTERLSLQQMQSNAQPNPARMEPVRRRIAALEAEVATARARLTEDGKDGLSLAKVQGELLVAQSDVTTRQLLLAQALEALETARVEAHRQTRYLSLSVRPVLPDEPAYPRAFENTLVVMLIFAGIYLMISMTVAILREQVSA